MLSPLLTIDRIDITTAPTNECWDSIHLALKLGRLNQSAQAAYTLVQRDPSQTQNYQQYLLTFFRLGAEFAEEVENYHHAAYYWEQITKQQPQNIDAWYGLGLARANLGHEHLPGAEMALIQALKLNPTKIKIRQNLTQVQSMLRG